MLVADGAVAELIQADVDFHSMIYRLSGNAAIAETVAGQWPHFMRSMGQVLTGPRARQRVWDEHAHILACILAANSAEAEAAARDHAGRTGEETARRLEVIANTKPKIA